MNSYYQDSMKALELKAKNPIKYAYLFKIKPLFLFWFTKSYSEWLFLATLEKFYFLYHDYKMRPKTGLYEDDVEAESLYFEIVDICDYWKNRKNIRDRVIDDQILIRIIRIRHKLPY